MVSKIKPGIYRHYKGKDYQVFHVVNHSETEERLVAYRCLYGDFSWWVRPLTMFLESVEIDGKSLPRFTYIGAASGEQVNEVAEMIAVKS